MDAKAVEAIALTIRTLTMDATLKASSGHPGMPMGAAELGAVLYGEILSLNPADPDWANRDRAVFPRQALVAAPTVWVASAGRRASPYVAQESLTPEIRAIGCIAHVCLFHTTTPLLVWHSERRCASDQRSDRSP